MKVELEANDIRFLIQDYEGWTVDNLPWKDSVYDISIVIFDESKVTCNEFSELINEMVLTNVDWVETLGQKSEWLHDEIDMASVRMGRQKAVGDGFPMTSWHDDIVECEEMADEVFRSILGGHDYRLIIVVGDGEEFRAFVDDFKEAIRCDEAEKSEISVMLHLISRDGVAGEAGEIEKKLTAIIDNKSGLGFELEKQQHSDKWLVKAKMVKADVLDRFTKLGFDVSLAVDVKYKGIT